MKKAGFGVLCLSFFMVMAMDVYAQDPWSNLARLAGTIAKGRKESREKRREEQREEKRLKLLEEYVNQKKIENQNNKEISEALQSAASKKLSSDSHTGINKACACVASIVSLNKEGKIIGTGSGVRLFENAVITNAHVVDGSDGVLIRMNEKMFDADPVFSSNEMDLCLLQSTELSEIPYQKPVLIDPKELRVGDKVFSVGSPKGLELSVADGIVSQVREVRGLPIIQTSAPISHGSSGGGLFDIDGSLVGITTCSVEDEQNLNFALSTDVIGFFLVNYMKKLKSEGKLPPGTEIPTRE
jgi:S1-C subfamily serine protease